MPYHHELRESLPEGTQSFRGNCPTAADDGGKKDIVPGEDSKDETVAAAIPVVRQPLLAQRPSATINKGSDSSEPVDETYRNFASQQPKRAGGSTPGTSGLLRQCLHARPGRGD